MVWRRATSSMLWARSPSRSKAPSRHGSDSSSGLEEDETAQFVVERMETAFERRRREARFREERSSS